MMNHLRHWLKICGIAIKRLFVERYTYRASALSFSTLLALVPLLSVILSIITIFPIFTRFIDLTRNYVLANFIPTSSNVIEHYLEAFTQQASRLPTLGIVFLFFTAVTLIMTVEHTFNDIWQTRQRKKRVVPILLYWVVLILTPVFIGFSVLLSSYIFSLSWFSGATTELGLKIPLLNGLPLLINTAMFSVLYVVVPNCHVRWRDGFFGGFIAALLFEIAKKVFAIYILKFPSYELIYGTLATVPIFLLWIYVSWLIILFGALVTNTQYKLQKK